MKQFPKRIDPTTPNQILLGNGLLVEADAPLYSPHVVSTDPSADFDDFPRNDAPSREQIRRT